MSAGGDELIGYHDVAGRRIAAVHHRAGGDPAATVVMAHGFKSSKIGPSRYFVELARLLASDGVSAFRFDQPGSGDSDGDFEDSTFSSWIDIVEHVARTFRAEGRRVALLGQSMGGVASLAASARLGDAIAGLALWSAGPALAGDDDWVQEQGEWAEEAGQRVRADFWRQAAEVDFFGIYKELAVPVYMVFGTADVFIPAEDARRVEAACKPGDRVRVIEGLPHSAWPYPERMEIIAETARFLRGVLSS